MDFTETPEYLAGRAWAAKNENRLVELYSSDDIIGGKLRTVFFEEAGKIYPAGGGDLENDLRQTLWVMGAFRHVVDTLPMTQEAMAAVFEAGNELGAIFASERAKLRCLKSLKEKSPEWWKKKRGDASPADVVAAAAVGWRIRRRKDKETRLEANSLWEILVDWFGSRELCVLDEARKIELIQDGKNWYYTIHAEDYSFQIIMRPTVEDGRMIHAPGDIIG